MKPDYVISRYDGFLITMMEYLQYKTNVIK